ncbi:MAG: tRNA (adenosine(37)-N6)-threonylcarbamoyltransferase complex ATPase subunit type 1 TsaE [Patescibacteria group bacterium]|jgi:tRNA threonylcarbamoyladenosine biosynthesis protein TsaE
MFYQTTSEKQTFNLGKKFAKELHGGEVILLSGDLGAGKTVFVKGLAAGLGVKKIITSPTFVLFKVYPIAKEQENPSIRGAGKRTREQVKYLVHADCYRLAKGGDILDAGLAEYCGRADTVVAVEWGERLGRLAGMKVIKVVLKLKKGGREVEVR